MGEILEGEDGRTLGGVLEGALSLGEEPVEDFILDLEWWEPCRLSSLATPCCTGFLTRDGAFLELGQRLGLQEGSSGDRLGVSGTVLVFFFLCLLLFLVEVS